MPTTRHVIALLAAAGIATAACKAGGPAKPAAEEAVAHPDDRIPAGGVVPAANALSAPRPAKLDPESQPTDGGHEVERVCVGSERVRCCATQLDLSGLALPLLVQEESDAAGRHDDAAATIEGAQRRDPATSLGKDQEESAVPRASVAGRVAHRVEHGL